MKIHGKSANSKLKFKQINESKMSNIWSITILKPNSINYFVLYAAIITSFAVNSWIRRRRINHGISLRCEYVVYNAEILVLSDAFRKRQWLKTDIKNRDGSDKLARAKIVRSKVVVVVSCKYLCLCPRLSLSTSAGRWHLNEP